MSLVHCLAVDYVICKSFHKLVHIEVILKNANGMAYSVVLLVFSTIIFFRLRGFVGVGSRRRALSLVLDLLELELGKLGMLGVGAGLDALGVGRLVLAVQ